MPSRLREGRDADAALAALRDFSDGYQSARRDAVVPLVRDAPSDGVSAAMTPRGAHRARAARCSPRSRRTIRRRCSRRASAPRTWCSLDLIARDGLADRDLHARHRTPARGDARAHRPRARALRPRRSTCSRPMPARSKRSSRSTASTASTTASSCARRCCAIRKVEPLARALAGKRGWITGLRREQSVTPRDAAERASSTPCTACAKFNPLADWTRGGRVGVPPRAPTFPYNALHDRATARSAARRARARSSPARHPRAGRWWWENPEHKECGLHRRSREGHGARHAEANCHERPLLEAEPRACADSCRTDRRRATSTGSNPRRSTSCARSRANARNPALLFSGGKDSLVMLRLAEKAFRPGRFPFPLLHIDTGHNFPGGDRVPRRARGRARRAPDRALGRGFDPQRPRRAEASRTKAAIRTRSVTLLDAIAEFEFDALHRRRAPRRGEGAREGAHLLASATNSANGTRATSAPSSGTSTTRACTRASTCACFRSATGPSSTSGSTSSARASKCRRSTTRTRAPIVRRRGAAGAGDRTSRRRATAKRSSEVSRALPHRGRHHLHVPGGLRGRQRATRSSPRPPAPRSPSAAPRAWTTRPRTRRWSCARRRGYF